MYGRRRRLTCPRQYRIPHKTNPVLNSVINDTTLVLDIAILPFLLNCSTFKPTSTFFDQRFSRFSRILHASLLRKDNTYHKIIKIIMLTNLFDSKSLRVLNKCLIFFGTRLLIAISFMAMTTH